MVVTFPQSYHIQQFLTIGRDCPVPEDEHGSIKFWVKGQIFKFHNN